MNSSNTAVLRRSEVWSQQLKEILQDDLQGMQYVNWLTDFPDGDTFTIPSIGEASVRTIQEDVPLVYDALDTGEFQFSITDYIGSAQYISNKARQDSFYASQLEAEFLPAQRRALDEYIETKILGLSASQTPSDLNTINGASHRFVGTGTNEVLAVADLAKVLYSLRKAKVPPANLVGIVDPSVEYTINTLSNIVNVSNNPRWEGIIADGMVTGLKFAKSIYGIDLYVSNYLAEANETIDGLTTAAGVANIFFSAQPNVLPFIGAFRQMPTVEGEYDMDLQREKYATICRLGTKLYRPENLVVVLTDTDQV